MAYRASGGGAGMRVVDCSHHYDNAMPLMEGIAPPEFIDLATVERDGYAMSRYTFTNHSGTHIDAPAHQIDGGATLDEIPLSRLVTDAAVLDVRSHEPGAIPLRDLDERIAEVRPNDLVLFCSGNDRNWGTGAYWKEWCYPDAEASRALIDRGVSGVGFDGPSADPVDSVTYELHRIWLSAGRVILENLRSLTELPSRCRIVCAPLKVRKANGGPVRVLALVEEGEGEALGSRALGGSGVEGVAS
ncbi:MAG: cyclase family protein [Acidimicrobiales bacterium]